MKPTIAEIVKSVEARFGLTRGAVTGCNRQKHIARARHAACHIARKNGYSLPEIGRAIGRDHTTVINSLNRAEHLLETDPDFSMRVNGAAIFPFFDARAIRRGASERMRKAY